MAAAECPSPGEAVGKEDGEEELPEQDVEVAILNESEAQDVE